MDRNIPIHQVGVIKRKPRVGKGEVIGRIAMGNGPQKRANRPWPWDRHCPPMHLHHSLERSRVYLGV